MADASFGSAMSSAFWLACVVAVVILQHSLLLEEVEGAPQADLVKRLPGQPKAPFKQYAGYIVVDEVAGRALFYYFVEAETHPESKPLTLWLNGGPGCSSVGTGAFEELGPFRPNGLGRGLVRNEHSWNKASNLLFVESPAGVGFSYSNTTSDRNTNDTKTGWFEKFPAYKSRDFFLTGESYAGHYIPQLASLLLEYNDRWTSQVFHLKGVAIGNPLLDLAIDIYARYLYQWSHGMLSDETFKNIENSCNFDVYTKNRPFYNESTKCNLYLKRSNVEVGNFIDYYDVNIDVCYTSIAKQEIRLNKKIHNFSLGVDVCMDNEIEFYMNLPKVQEAFHANTTHLSYKWSRCRSVVGQ